MYFKYISQRNKITCSKLSCLRTTKIYFLSHGMSHFRRNTLNASPSQSYGSYILNFNMYVIIPTQQHETQIF